MSAQLGLVLRDAALAQSQRGREERIRAVREKLVRVLQVCGYLHDHAQREYVTADDAMDAAEILGLLSPGEESRWIAHVFLHWPLVENTGRVVRSRRAVNHGRRISLWRWK